jgi:hypothetical protein
MVNVHFNTDSVWGILDMPLYKESIFHNSFAITNSVIKNLFLYISATLSLE